jgi:hypothetical protein
MQPHKLKELVIGSIDHAFNTWVDIAAKASNGDSKAIPAIHAMQKSIVAAASSVEARVYADDEFSAKIVAPGIDLAYRAAVVSDSSRDDEWIAVLAIGFEHLDEHTRKVLHSHVDPRVKNSNLAGAETRRLLVSLVCAKKTVTLDPFFTVVVETFEKNLALIPAPPSWVIPQPNGQHLLINHMEADTYQERLDIASRRLSVIDSAPAATLMNAHVRGTSGGSMH